MARIEFDDVEQKMKDLHGYCKMYLDDEKNPYTTDELTDDEYNFISGFNYALSYVTDLFIANREVTGLETDLDETLDKVLEKCVNVVIEKYAQYGYMELEELITVFLENHEYDD